MCISGTGISDRYRPVEAEELSVDLPEPTEIRWSSAYEGAWWA